MPRIARQELLERFRAKIAAGRPLIGGGAGTGLSAKCEEAGGIDLIVIYNSGRYRMAGRGSLAGVLAYGNANEIVCEMAREVLPVVKHTPVLAGVNGTDPFMIADDFLRRLINLGFSGVQNFPTVGLIDGTFRANLEETGMGYGLEVELIARARELDLLTTPYVFNEAEAKAMAAAGADIIVCHMGLTTGGAIGAETALKLSDCVAPINAWAAVARDVNPEVIVLCHGGPIATPDDAAYILKHCPGIQGFYGASSMERLPTEVALTETTRRFCAIERTTGQIAERSDMPKVTKEAAARALESSLGHQVKGRDFIFANVNSAKDVWWMDIPLARVNTDSTDELDLVLASLTPQEVHHLRVPTKFLRDHLKDLDVRSDKACISLELRTAPSGRFTDGRGNGHLNLAPFHLRSIPVSI